MRLYFAEILDRPRRCIGRGEQSASVVPWQGHDWLDGDGNARFVRVGVSGGVPSGDADDRAARSTGTLLATERSGSVL